MLISDIYLTSDVFIRLRHYVTNSWIHAGKSYYDQGNSTDKKAVMQKVIHFFRCYKLYKLIYIYLKQI